MALRLNPPPNWSTPPEGFELPVGWQPDPTWRPAPEGWQVWVDDSVASAVSAAGTASETNPAWVPAQAVPIVPMVSLSTVSLVTDPTGMSVPTPSGDYAGTPVIGGGPYAANMDYAQSSTPYQPQGAVGDMQPPTGGRQPNAAVSTGPGNGSKPLTRQWQFQTGIAAIAVVALVIDSISMFKGDSSELGDKADSTSTSEPKGQREADSDSKRKVSDSNEAGSSGQEKAIKTSKPDSNDPGSSEKSSLDPRAGPTVLNIGRYDDDPNTLVGVTIDDAEWDANGSVKVVTSQYSYREPPVGKVYTRVPVKATCHGEGQSQEFRLQVRFTHEGNTLEAGLSIGGQSLFTHQSVPRDGGKAKGDSALLVNESAIDKKKGAFVVSAFLQMGNKNEVYVTVE